MPQPEIVIDLRCLQDPVHAERGIAAHARNVIIQARNVSDFARKAKIIGIIDPNLPAVDASAAATIDEINTNAYLPFLKPGSLFLNPSPMTGNQIFVARILTNPHLHKAVLVYDFIPYDDQKNYMTNRVTRLDYFTSMAWLKKYDIFLPISEHTNTRLHEIYGLRNRPCFVTGVHIAPWLENVSAPAPAPRHILAITGDDPRKNPELLIKAHALSGILQSRRIPLVIGGKYPPDREKEFKDFAENLGGDPSLVSLPGKISNEALLVLYRRAFCVVTPSRAEGFSMPVVEAMAAGIPSIASDIPAHAELVKEPELRFDPDDNVKLGALLERIVQDSKYRTGIINAQSKLSLKYKAENVARAVWSGIEACQPAGTPASFVIGGRRPRLAMLTPLPPAQSGVADYSAACAASLAKLTELELFSASADPTSKPLSALPHLSNRFDRVVSVMGNSTYHSEIFDFHTRYGSACICHDAQMLHFSVWKFGPAGAAKIVSRELGREVTESEILYWHDNETKPEALCFGGIATSAKPMIFHAKAAAEAFEKQYGLQAHYLPFAIYRPWETGGFSPSIKQTARLSLGFDNSELNIISLGFVSESKGVSAGIRAISLLGRMNIKARLIWVGKIWNDVEKCIQEAEDLGVAGRIVFTNQFFTEAQYRDYLLAADCGLQLRVGGAGNISGALQDCISAGLPTVASKDLAESLEAPSYVTRVSDSLNPTEIAAALAALAGNKPETSAERDAYVAAHSMDIYSKRLCGILELEV